MYAFLLILLLLLFYWYSRRAPPPPVYEAPIIPDLTNTINTGPTDMALVLPVTSPANIYTSPVDNSIMPVGTSVAVPDMTSTDVMNIPAEVVAPANNVPTPPANIHTSPVDNSVIPVGTSVAVPDMTSTDVMNIPAEVSVPIVAGGSVDPVAGPTVAELSGEYVANVKIKQPIPSNICICHKWTTNKNMCMTEPKSTGYIVHKTKNRLKCPDPVCQITQVIGIHDYVKFFPGVPIPSIVMTSPNNTYGLCKCVQSKYLCTKNKGRCTLKNSKEPCLWPQCKNQVSNDQIKLETIYDQKQKSYTKSFNGYKSLKSIHDSKKNSLDSYISSLKTYRENVKVAELVYNEAASSAKKAVDELSRAQATNKSLAILTSLRVEKVELEKVAERKLNLFNESKQILVGMENALPAFQKEYDKARILMDNSIEKVKKAETEARNAHKAAYAADTGKGFVAYVISAFGNIAGFLNYRSGYRSY
jgi:3D (Asp-Asp-Asp) domain-containing protein